MGKRIFWLGSTLSDLTAASETVRRTMGGALRAAQEGETSGDATPMKGALRDVIEVREDDEAGTHRLMYTVEIPQADLNRIAGRLKTARRHAASLKDASR